MKLYKKQKTANNYLNNTRVPYFTASIPDFQKTRDSTFQQLQLASRDPNPHRDSLFSCSSASVYFSRAGALRLRSFRPLRDYIPIAQRARLYIYVHDLRSLGAVIGCTRAADVCAHIPPDVYLCCASRARARALRGTLCHAVQCAKKFAPIRSGSVGILRGADGERMSRGTAGSAS